MIDSTELERRKAICLRCPDFRTRDRSVVWCHRRAKRPNDGVYCLPWAANEYRKMLLDDKPNGGCPKWHEDKMSEPETFPPLPENPQDGVLILSTGSQRRQWLWNCIASVRRHRPDLGVHVLSDVPVDVPSTWIGAMTGKASRWYKTQADRLSPFPGLTLLLDDDCIMHRPFPPLTELLGDCDLAAKTEPGCATVGATCQAGKHGWITDEEKSYTRGAVNAGAPHYNSGVFLFRKTPVVHALFEAWHAEWLRFQHIDQLALSRALAAHPVSIAGLGEPHNYRSERRERDNADPFVFHCHRKSDNDTWYHTRHAQPAVPHATYLAFCRAVDKGQWSRDQYESLGRLVHARSPLNLLVWGCGHDSDLWRALNSGGRTVFVETDAQWAKGARSAGCEVVDWQPPTSRGVPYGVELPACPAGGDWDVILIDGPPGHAGDTPGRELPIRWAAESSPTIVAVHDLSRPWERWCADRYLGPPSHWIPGDKGLLGIWSRNPIAEELLR